MREACRCGNFALYLGSFVMTVLSNSCKDRMMDKFEEFKGILLSWWVRTRELVVFLANF